MVNYSILNSKRIFPKIVWLFCIEKPKTKMELTEIFSFSENYIYAKEASSDFESLRKEGLINYVDGGIQSDFKGLQNALKERAKIFSEAEKKLDLKGLDGLMPKGSDILIGIGNYSKLNELLNNTTVKQELFSNETIKGLYFFDNGDESKKRIKSDPFMPFILLATAFQFSKHAEVFGKEKIKSLLGITLAGGYNQPFYLAKCLDVISKNPDVAKHLENMFGEKE